jgi:hypothetical protein
MTSLQSKLRQIGEAFAGITPRTYHYWRPVKEVPCLIWSETGEASAMHAGNRKVEQAIAGTVDVYTKTEFDPLLDTVQDTLDSLGLAWVLDASAYEDDTGLIHYTWSWEVANNGEV